MNENPRRIFGECTSHKMYRYIYDKFKTENKKMTLNPYARNYEDELGDDGEIPKCCDNPDIGVSGDGLNVCRSCGLTFGQSFVSQERRAYTAEEVKQRRRTEPRLRSYGPRTVISIVKTDAKGRQLAAKEASLYLHA